MTTKRESKPPAKKKAAPMSAGDVQCYAALDDHGEIAIHTIEHHESAVRYMHFHEGIRQQATVVPVIVREVAPAKKRRGRK